MKLIFLLYRIIRRIRRELNKVLDKQRTRFLFRMYNVDLKHGLVSNGVPIVHLSKGAFMSVGNCLTMNNGIQHNRIGRQQRCNFMLGRNAELIIGNDVGMSSTAIVCLDRIEIGDNVMLGGNVCIYDTDFHSLDPSSRNDPKSDAKERKIKPIRIERNVFVGAHSTILKGVTIGEESIIGAGSVVTRNIPPRQIWAGNPAKFIRDIERREEREAA